MGQRRSIFCKLPGPQQGHILNSLHRARVQVTGKLLVPEHRKSFFQTQLKPIPQSHTIACPIVEVLMPDNTFDSFVVHVCCRLGCAEDVLGIEDVQALVLHGSHVEIIHCNNIEQVQIVFQTKAFLIPLHGFDQGIHCMLCLICIVSLGPNSKRDFLSIHCDECFFFGNKIPGHEREQVAWFFEGIFPDRKVFSSFELAFFHKVAIG
mmetsp:Transcript_7593/g.46753  ORF Transcript_7593/g.46753 Transcript_7593/m.46753 type:complete len:207 (-) Transcript_7593:668-1288(-)